MHVIEKDIFFGFGQSEDMFKTKLFPLSRLDFGIGFLNSLSHWTWKVTYHSLMETLWISPLMSRDIHFIFSDSLIKLEIYQNTQ